MNETMAKPNERSSSAAKHKKIIAIVVVITVVIVLAIIAYIRTSVHQFKIESHNGVLDYESFYPETRLNYTVYVRIRNVLGASNSVTLYCELTREDLVTVTKPRTVIIEKGEEKIVTFFFSNEDLLGKPPVEYRVYISSKMK